MPAFPVGTSESASATDKNSCCHRQPCCHKHPPTPDNPRLLLRTACPIPSPPAARCSVCGTIQQRPVPASQVTSVWQHGQTKSMLLNFSFPLCGADKMHTLGQLFWEFQKENEAATISRSQKAVLSIPPGFRTGKGQGRRVISKVCPHSSKLLGVNRLASQKGLTNSLHSAVPPSFRSC